MTVHPDFAMCIAALAEKERKERERYGFALYQIRRLKQQLERMQERKEGCDKASERTPKSAPRDAHSPSV